MKSSELFGIIVRTCGLLMALNGLWYLMWVVFLGTGVIAEQNPLTPSDNRDYLFVGLAWLMGGAGLLRGASWVVRFSYPKNDANGTTETSVP